jgi:hypothetical protein
MQMTPTLVPTTNSNFNEGVGLSDEEELRRFAMAASIQEVGEETLIDMSEDLRELGIEQT